MESEARLAAQLKTGRRLALPVHLQGLRRALRLQLHQMTLLRRLLILEAAALVVLVVVTVLIIQSITGALERQIKHERLVLAQSIADEVDDEVRSTSHEMSLVSANLQLAPNDKDGRQAALDYLYLDNARTTNLGVFLVGSDGRVLMGDSVHANISPPVPVASLAPQEPMYRVETAGGSSRLVWMINGPDRPLLAMAVPVAGSAQSPPGYVVGLIDPLDSKLTEDLNLAVTLGHTGHASVVDSRGFTILSSQPGAAFQTSEHGAFYTAKMAQGVPAVDTVRTLETASNDGADPAKTGEDHVMAFAPLQSLPWGVGVGGTVSETFAPVRRLQRSMLAILGGLVAFGVVGTIFVARKMVQPVLELQTTAQRVAAGELEPPIRVAVGGEIGKMAESLEAMRLKLQGWGLELEERVRQRTAELEQRNRELATTAGVAEASASSVSSETIFEKASTHILAMPGIDAVAFYLLEGGASAALRQQFAVGLSDRLLQERGARTCEACVAECAVESGQVWQAATTSGLGQVPACLREGFSSVATVPLVSPTRPLGVMCVLSRHDKLSEADLKVLKMIGYQIGEGVETSLLYSRIQEQERHLRLLLEQVLVAQEDERQRVARELHDETGQALAAISMGLDSLDKVSSRQRQRERLQELRRFSGEALSDLKRMVVALRPPVLDDMGLAAAVRRYADQHLAGRGIQIELHCEGLEQRLDQHTEVVVFRIVQEAINNISRHSGATHATVALGRRPGIVSGRVQDDGAGFNLERVMEEGGGSAALGLLGMQERASLVGGSLTLQTTPGTGTEVRFQIPIRGEEEGSVAS